MIKRRKKRASCGLILLYHRVIALDSDPWELCVSPPRFRQQMQWVREHCDAVSLTEMPRLLRKRAHDRPLVAVTFDDGYEDNLQEALPVLESCGIPATFFLTTPWLVPSREYWWDELDRIFLCPGELPAVLRLVCDPEAPTWRLGYATQYTAAEAAKTRQWRSWEPPPTVRHTIYSTLWKRLFGMRPQQRQLVLDELFEWANMERFERPTHRRLSRDDVLHLSHSRVVEVGAHTVGHAVLTSMSASEREREIKSSKLALETLVNRPVTSFAYPHGDYCPETKELVREAGFLRACTTREGTVRKDHDAFELPRFQVGDWDGIEFAKHLASWSSRKLTCV